MNATQRTMTYADVFRPEAKDMALFYDIALVIGGSLLVAMLAQVAIPLPFTPVPITGQTLGVLLVGMLLGSRRGALSIVAYLAEGAAGLPFFAGGKAGAALLVGATGGYLMGFIVAAGLVGWLAERGFDRNIPKALVAMTLGTATILLFGVTWLSTLIGFSQAMSLGVVPVLPGAVIKITLAALILPTGWHFLGKRS
jgi:biotin transport system substrate-specific component